jgi:hypothetical protein
MQNSRFGWLSNRGIGAPDRSVPFSGGRIPDPFNSGLRAIFKTKSDAQEFLSIDDPTKARHRPRSYDDDEAIAYIVTFVILTHSTGESAIWTQPFGGGAS